MGERGGGGGAARGRERERERESEREKEGGGTDRGGEVVKEMKAQARLCLQHSHSYTANGTLRQDRRHG